MPSNTDITVAQLSCLIGLPDSPVIIDVRDADDYPADPRLIPGARRRDHRTVSEWSRDWPTPGSRAVIVCQRGLKLSEGVAAILRARGVAAEVLEGGFLAWRDAGGLLFDPAKPPGCWRPRSASPAPVAMISNSSRPAWPPTTPSTAGAATPSPRPTTGRDM